MVAYLGYIQQEQQADNAHLELKQEAERLNYEWHMAFKNLFQSHLLNLSTQSYQLEIKYSSIWVYGKHSH